MPGGASPGWDRFFRDNPAATLATTLFIHGGDDFARSVFRTEGRGYWSQALPLVLEKHGYLAVETAGPDALRDTELLRDYSAVLVARLPPGVWTPHIAQRATDGTVPVLVEGPLPSVLLETLGIDSARDSHPYGSVKVVDPDLLEAAARFGHPAGGDIGETQTRPIPREPRLDWQSIEAVPLSPQQARAWRARSWDAQSWTVRGDSRVLAQWKPSNGHPERAAVLRRGSLTACALGLFSYLGQGQTSEPFEGPEHRIAARRTGLEMLLLALIDDMHARAGTCRVRTRPWPAGFGWVRNIRHDYDRPVRSVRVRRLLRRYDRLGVASTWYWRPLHLTSRALARVAANGRHEIALHTERVWAPGGDEERTRLESASGKRVVGTSAHGGIDCFRYQGAPNLLWAQRMGFLYSEAIQHAHMHPYRFGKLNADGTIAALDVICLPHHESLDRSSRSGDTQAERIRAVLPTWIRAGGMLQIMNHPDINRNELIHLLSEMPPDGRADWTAAQACDWWRRSHVHGELTLKALPEGGFSAQARGGVRRLLVEVLHPDGTTVERVLDLAPGERQVVRERARLATFREGGG